MSNHQRDSGPTTNDLLRRLVAKHSPPALNDDILGQRAEDMPKIENLPAVAGPGLPDQLARNSPLVSQTTDH